MAGIVTLLNLWYMIRSRRLHNLCIKRRKLNKKIRHVDDRKYK